MALHNLPPPFRLASSAASSAPRPAGATGLPRPGCHADANIVDLDTAARVDADAKRFGALTSTTYHEAVRCLLGGPMQLNDVAENLSARTGMSRLKALAVLNGEVMA